MNDSDSLPSDLRSSVDPNNGCSLSVHDDSGRLLGVLGGVDQSLQPPDKLNSGEDSHESHTSSGCPSEREMSVEDSNASLLEGLEDSNSATSNASELSGFSDMSGRDWKPHAGPMSWIHRQMLQGADPRSILVQLIPMNAGIPTNIDDLTLWKLIIEILTEPPRRHRLRHINTLEDVRRLISCSKKILIVTGAGVSVSCGIPDFRSRNGLYARLSVDFPGLPDPQAMFDIQYFDKDPRPFFKFAREIYPGQFEPSPAHKFIRLVEEHGKLLRNYSQNIDTLENVAGIKNVIHCHGSFATASCMRCQLQVDAEAIREDIFNQKIPVCRVCCPSGELDVEFGKEASAENPVEQTDLLSAWISAEDSSSPSSPKSPGDPEVPRLPILKPDIVFFGEGLPEKFHTSMAADKDDCDLLIVIGSSLKVRPVALIPSSVPHSVPLILINREPLNHVNFDVQLLGDCDVICNELCARLGETWSAPGLNNPPLTELTALPSRAGSRLGEDSCSSSLPAVEEDDEPKSEHDLEALRRCWQPKVKESVAQRLPEGAYLFMPPNRYVFPGAEIYMDADDDDDDDGDSSSSSSSSSSAPASPPSPPFDSVDSANDSNSNNGVNGSEAVEENSVESVLSDACGGVKMRVTNVPGKLIRAACPPPSVLDDEAASLPSPKIPRLE